MQEIISKSIFSSQWITQLLEKLWIHNVREHKDIKIVKNQTIVEQNFSLENVLANEIKITQAFMDKPIYWGLSISAISKIIMYEFWHDCVKQKYREMENYVIWIQAAL